MRLKERKDRLKKGAQVEVTVEADKSETKPRENPN
jgi:hypothetical protein